MPEDLEVTHINCLNYKTKNQIGDYDLRQAQVTPFDKLRDHLPLPGSKVRAQKMVNRIGIVFKRFYPFINVYKRLIH